MKNLLLLCFLSICFSVNSQTLQWSVFTDSVPTLSSPRAADLNNDGVLDIVLGAGTDSTYSIYGIMAFDGLNGNNLWTLPATDEIFGSAVFNDVNADNIPDVFIGGRNAQFYAIDGSNGNIVWTETSGFLQFNEAIAADLNNAGPPISIYSINLFVFLLSCFSKG